MLFALLSFLMRSANSQTCPIFECNSIEEEDTCVIPKPNTNSTFIVSKCKNANKHCALVSDEPTMKTKCEDKEKIKYKLYPGLTCESNDDCFNNNCHVNKTKKCIGKKLKEPCNRHDECNLGYKCADGQCLSLSSECEVDEDCSMNSGCFMKNCVEYFSLEDGYNVSTAKQTPFLSFCKGGYAIDGLCVTLKLDGKYEEPCNKENKSCIYIDGEGNKHNLPDMCKCGYGEKGNSYCKLGGGEANFTRYKNNLLASYTKNCAQPEHGALLGCNADKRNPSMRENLTKLYNQYLWANYNYRMYDAAVCVVQVEFPDYDIDYDDPENVAKKCARYKCELSRNDDGVCLKSTYNRNDGVNVKLFYNLTFMENQTCQVDPKKELETTKDVEKKWENQTEKIIIGIRLPGEDCKESKECDNWKYPEVPKLSNCINNKCGGFGKGEKCSSHDMCLVGFYCDIIEQRCKFQKDINETCQSSSECLNHLLCYQKKCNDVLYKFDIGHSFKAEDIMDNDDFFKGKLCKYGITDYSNETCIAYEYASEMDPNEDFIECNRSDPNSCEYKVLSSKGNVNIIRRDCECGYNSNGTSYCPLDHISRIEQWDDFYSIKRQLANNTCHTMNRYNCYKNKRDRRYLTDMHSMYLNTLKNGHLFYKSEPCVEKMLKANYANVNIIFYIMSSIILFICI